MPTPAASTLDFPILTSLILLPVLGAIIIAFLPKEKTDVIKATGFIVATATFGLAAYLVVEFSRHDPNYQFVSLHSWIPSFGISWHLGVDGISLFLVALTALLFPIAIVGPPIKKDAKTYVAWLLILEAGCVGSFVALDLFLFFIFFEVVLVPMYFIIGGWGYDNRVYAALKFFLFTLVGSALMLVGILAYVFLNSKGQPITFDLVVLSQRHLLSTTAADWIFLTFAVAFCVKVPLFPLHTWLPDAHTEAPTAGSVILAGVLLKLGTYGLLRFGVFLFPQQAEKYAPIFLTLAVIGIIYGAVVAVVQKDLKRLVAYSSVAHLGFIVLGIFALTSQGITGGVLQNINHGLSTGALFLLVGMIYERRHTREISQLNGLQKAAPVLAGVFTVVLLSSIGVPGLNGFVGEYLALFGTFISHRWWAVVATAGVILAALYMLWAYQRVFHGEPDVENAKVSDMTLLERLVIAPLLLFIVLIGVYPKPFLDRITPSVEKLTQHVEAQTRSHPKTGQVSAAPKVVK